MPPNFTRRADELRLLDAWLDDGGAQPLLLVRALGGFGKSALTWHWLHGAVSHDRWPRVLWWSFYEAEASFDSFLPNALEYLGRRGIVGPRLQADALLDELRLPGVLLVLDGFERELRPFSGMGSSCATLSAS